MPKLSMGTGSRVLMCHGGPPLCRGPHDSANDSLELKLRPVREETLRQATQAASERAAGGTVPRALWAASVVRQPRRRVLVPWARHPVMAALLLRGCSRRVFIDTLAGALEFP